MSESQQELVRRLREQAWAEGYEACYRGEQRYRNPYRADALTKPPDGPVR